MYNRVYAKQETSYYLGGDARRRRDRRRGRRRGSDLDGFATCLMDKGVKFYGAYWCSHCQAQKALFGTAAGKLPYVECSTPDGQGENPICIQEGIKGYPTWVFTDGSRLSGEISLATLSEKSECVLPVASSTSSQ